MKSLCASSSSRATSWAPSWPARWRRDVGVVGEDLHAEALEPLGDERADPAEADDADLLVEQLDAAVLAALPRAALEGLVGRRDVAGGGQQQADGELGGGGDVGGRRVDDHDAGLGGGRDVDVVEADTGAGDDLEVLARRRWPRRPSWWPSGSAPRRRRRAPGAARRGRRRRTWRTSKSGPRASMVAGESSSAIRTTGLAHVTVLHGSGTMADPSARRSGRCGSVLLRHRAVPARAVLGTHALGRHTARPRCGPGTPGASHGAATVRRGRHRERCVSGRRLPRGGGPLSGRRCPRRSRCRRP